MFESLALGVSLVAAQSDGTPSAFQLDDQVESAAAVAASLRFEPLSGRLVLSEREDDGGWSRQESSEGAGRLRRPFVLRYDAATGRLSFTTTDGMPAMACTLPLGEPNLLRLEVANFDPLATSRLERMKLSLAGRTDALHDLGRGAMTRELATLWSPELGRGFELSGEIVVRGESDREKRLFIDFGLGHGRRVEVEVDGAGEVRSTPPRLTRLPDSKVAVGYFGERERVSLEAVGEPFAGWESGATESTERRIELGAGAGATSWSARFESGAAENANDPTPEATRGFLPSNHLLTNGAPIAVPSGEPEATEGPASPYPATLTVSGPIGGAITDLNLQLKDVTHAFPDDLDVLLVSPFGTAVLVMSDACGSGDLSAVDWEFDDEAAGPLADEGGVGCAAGSVQPTSIGAGDTFDSPAPAGPYAASLSAFDDQNSNGNWSLYVMDDATTDSGAIAAGWGLEWTTAGFRILIPTSGTSGPADPYPAERFATQSYVSFGTVVDVNVYVTGVTHPHGDDLDILLVAPSGKSVILMSDACGSADIVAFGWIFDDEAPAPMSDADLSGCDPVVVQPTDYGAPEDWPAPAPAGPHATTLSAFDGDVPFGTWSLYVRDDAGGDAGYVSDQFLLEILTTGIFRDGFDFFKGTCAWSQTVPPSGDLCL